MDYKLINEILKDLSRIQYSNEFSVVTDSSNIEGDYEEFIRVYRYKDTDIFIKITTSTDSYGYNEGIRSVQFVKPVVKQVTDFETI